MMPDPLASLNLQAADKADVYCQACPEFNSWRSTRCGRLIHSATQVFLSKFCQCRDERQCALLIFKLGKPAFKTQSIYAKLYR